MRNYTVKVFNFGVASILYCCTISIGCICVRHTTKKNTSLYVSNQIIYVPRLGMNHHITQVTRLLVLFQKKRTCLLYGNPYISYYSTCEQENLFLQTCIWKDSLSLFLIFSTWRRSLPINSQNIWGLWCFSAAFPKNDIGKEG